MERARKKIRKEVLNIIDCIEGALDREAKSYEELEKDLIEVGRKYMDYFADKRIGTLQYALAGLVLFGAFWSGVPKQFIADLMIYTLVKYEIVKDIVKDKVKT